MVKKKHYFLGQLGKVFGNCEAEYLSKPCMGLHNDGLSLKDGIYSKEHEIKAAIHIPTTLYMAKL